MTSAPTDFYPRPPRGGRRLYRHSQADVVNFYPRPPRGGRPPAVARGYPSAKISIHALREEGDKLVATSLLPTPYFYPRPPQGGRRQTGMDVFRWWMISIHALRKEGDDSFLVIEQTSDIISIHALREEGDHPHRDRRLNAVTFLSTPSARRATLRHETLKPHRKAISIHALREEGDSSAASPRASPAYFYPRPPRGGRLFVLQKSQIFFDYFYPRPPRGGRPGCGGELAVNVNISIHALREEGDDCGTQGLRWIAISIHALREEGDGRRYFMGLFNFLFLSTPSARRATFPTSKPTRKQSYFYPRPPRGGRPTPSKTGRRGGDFYPRPPRGGRPLKDDGLVAIKKFLSTPSARRATSMPCST